MGVGEGNGRQGLEIRARGFISSRSVCSPHWFKAACVNERGQGMSGVVWEDGGLCFLLGRTMKLGNEENQ